jgi:hypothetical protein
MCLVRVPAVTSRPPRSGGPGWLTAGAKEHLILAESSGPYCSQKLGDGSGSATFDLFLK